MSEEISGRDFGRIEADVNALKAQCARLEANQERGNAKLDVLVQAVTEAKGGWKMLMMVGSAAAVIGAAMSKLVLWAKGG